MTIKTQGFFDKQTYTMTYVVYDSSTKDAIIIDPVLDYDAAASEFYKKSVNTINDFVVENDLSIHYILETHAHADHISGAQALKSFYPKAKIGIGKNITVVQETFKDVFNLEKIKTDGTQFDVLLDENNELVAGSIVLKTIFTPGHTPACASYLIEDMLFTGDALFMPDFGTGRCDFPAGSAKDLYHSVHEKLYSLPDETRVFVGHDYQPGGRDLKFETSIGESKKMNKQLKAETSEAEYVEFRTTRDARLGQPRLIYPSIQLNVEAGRIPKPENNGMSYIKLPISEKAEKAK